MIRRAVALSALVACACANAFIGRFDPQPLRHEVTITFIDSQLPGLQCVAEQPRYAAPVVLMAIGCANYERGIVIVPISPGVGWLNNLQYLATPNALLGHETRHLFDGDYHPLVAPWFERVRRPSQAAGSVVPGDKHD